MQRTRCRYFRDPTVAACNKRAPGSGCAAVTGAARMHAILGASEHCIAVHASDLCVSLVALDAVVHIRGAGGERSVPLTEFYLVPGERPDIENVLEHGELITAIEVPMLPVGARSGYLKVRDRASYEFALTSAAAALVIEDGTIATARVAVGGVGTIPWRAREAEAILTGATASSDAFRSAAEAAIQDPFTVPGTAFKSSSPSERSCESCRRSRESSRDHCREHCDRRRRGGPRRRPAQGDRRRTVPVGLLLRWPRARRAGAVDDRCRDDQPNRDRGRGGGARGTDGGDARERAGARGRADDAARPESPNALQRQSHPAPRPARGHRSGADTRASNRGGALGQDRIPAEHPDTRDRESRRGGPAKPVGLELQRGDAEAALASAEVLYDETFGYRGRDPKSDGAVCDRGVLGEEPSDRARLHPVARDGEANPGGRVRSAGERRTGARALPGRRVRRRAASLAARHPGRARSAACGSARQGRPDPPADVHLDWAPRAIATAHAARVYKRRAAGGDRPRGDLHARRRGLQHRPDHDAHRFRVRLPERRDS